MSKLAKVILISVVFAPLGALFSCYAVRFFVSNSSPAWFVAILVPLVVVTILASIIAVPVGLVYGYAFILAANHFVVTKIGRQTTGTIISSKRCDDSEDICVCGVYSYHDWLQWEHKFRFRYCWHWPRKEDWDKVMQSCGLGAENPVYYLPWLPFIHEIQWNVDNENIGERPIASHKN